MGIDDIVLNWIKKAESDLKTAKDEIQTENPADRYNLLSGSTMY
jgi:hypothetical protein